MTQLYATGSAEPAMYGTMTFLVSTPIEPLWKAYMWGVGTAVILIFLGMLAYYYLVSERKI